MKDPCFILNDSDTRKDIMSILVWARKAELGGGYIMNDRAMMDQVVNRYSIVTGTVPFPGCQCLDLI